MQATKLIRSTAKAIALICLIGGATTFAQSLTTPRPPSAETAQRSQYVISARAGGVNLVSGAAMLQKRGESARQPLSSRDDLEPGDAVTTGANGFVEILLAPGSYFRMGPNSSVEVADTALDHIRLRVNSGSAIAEIAGDNNQPPTEIDTPHTPIFIAKSGLYRVNVRPKATELLVRKGEARVGSETTGTRVKKNKMLTINESAGPTAQSESSLDKDNQDMLDTWSKERAQTLAAANRRLRDSSLNTALAGFMSSDRLWLARYSPFGLWVYDPFIGFRTFLPFNPWWGSPYGFGYRLYLGPPYRYYYPGRVIIRRPGLIGTGKTRPTAGAPRSRINPGPITNPGARPFPRHSMPGGARPLH
jgi:hypothetical protein